MRTHDSIIREIESIGKRYTEYKFCSYDFSAICHTNSIINFKHRCTIFFGLKDSFSTRSVSSENQNLEIALNDLIHKIELEFNISKPEPLGFPLTQDDFIPINMGIWEYKNSNNRFIFQLPSPYDKSRRAQNQPHIIVDTILCKYDKPVDNFEHAIKIFNDEYR